MSLNFYRLDVGDFTVGWSGIGLGVQGYIKKPPEEEALEKK